MLVILSGLPGTGKTAVASLVATTVGAVHLRIDSIEQALRNIGREIEADGYVAAYAIAEDNLRLGQTVIADCVNPWPATRAAWRSVAARAGVRAIEVEVVCSDLDEHRRRIESRVADIPGHRVPTWAEVLAHDYRTWDSEASGVSRLAYVEAPCLELLSRARHSPRRPPRGLQNSG